MKTGLHRRNFPHAYRREGAPGAMGDRFRKFVEWGTEARYVPLNARCCMCDKRMGLFATGFWSINAKRLSDGVLCAACHARLGTLLEQKKEWMPPAMRRTEPWKRYGGGSMATMSVQEAKALLALKEQCDKAVLDGYDEGAGALMRVQASFRIAPNALQAGVVRARRLQGKAVAYGPVDEGAFAPGDAVRIDAGGTLLESAVIEAFRDDEANDFDMLLRAGAGKRPLRENMNGWLVLELETELPAGSRIVK